MMGPPFSERFAKEMRKMFNIADGARVLEDQHADETKIEDVEIYCASCNATEQGFDFKDGAPVCRICGRPCQGAE